MIQDPSAERQRCLMVVEDDPDLGYALSRWLNDRNIRPLLTTTTHEALQKIRGVQNLKAPFDGLLVDYQLPDATGCRVIQEFIDEIPGVPVALMTGYTDISVELWVRAHRIPLFRKPLRMDEVERWILLFK